MASKKGKSPSFWKQVQLLNERYCEEQLHAPDSFRSYKNYRACAFVNGKPVNI